MKFTDKQKQLILILRKNRVPKNASQMDRLLEKIKDVHRNTVASLLRRDIITLSFPRGFVLTRLGRKCVFLFVMALLSIELQAQQFKVGDSVRVSDNYLKKQAECDKNCENPQVILVPSQFGVVTNIAKKFPGYYIYKVNYAVDLTPDSALDNAMKESYTIYTEVWLRKKHLKKK